MRRPLALAAAVAAALALVELATGADTHLFAGGWALFGVVGALALGRAVKALGASWLQRSEEEDGDG